MMHTDGGTALQANQLANITRTAWYSEEMADYGLGHENQPEPPPPYERNDGGHNLIASLCTDGKHRPAIDIDIPCRYVPSSTPGHGHLYLDDLPLEWDAYVELLEALVKAGIVDKTYLDHSIKRGYTALRPRHITKTGSSL